MERNKIANGQLIFGLSEFAAARDGGDEGRARSGGGGGGRYIERGGGGGWFKFSSVTANMHITQPDGACKRVNVGRCQPLNTKIPNHL